MHHFHYGIVFLLAGCLALLYSGRGIFTIIMFGLGMGLVLDEFFLTLNLPGNRPLEMEIYKKSLKNTILLFFLIVFVVLMVSVFKGKLFF